MTHSALHRTDHARRADLPKVVVLDADNTRYDWVEYFAVGWRHALGSVHKLADIGFGELQGELRR